MSSNKLVVKCGNFAVLVDLHVLPRGSSKDTSWFSDHEKEEVCMLLKDPIDARVKQFVEAPKCNGQQKHKEFTHCNPLFLRGHRFRIAAYFMKRWVNLRCILKPQYRGLRVFPDRIIVCASLHEPPPSVWTTDNSILNENGSSGISEYFVGCTKNGNDSVPSATKRQKGILREIIKKTQIKDWKVTKPLANKMLLGSVDFKTDHRKIEDLTPDGLPEAERGSAGQLTGCTKTVDSILAPPPLGPEGDINRRQAGDEPRPGERGKPKLLVKKLLSSSEPELPDTKRSRATTQHKRRRHISDENPAMCKKVAYGRDGGSFSLRDVLIIQKNSDERSVQTLDPKLSTQCCPKPVSIEHLVQGPFSENRTGQISQNKPVSSNDKCSSICKSSQLETYCSPSEILPPETTKMVENHPRKLKLQRNKR
ncbi:protein SLX4IP isoform X1 [Ambystoma mexicanum]|uniref:protein SLX4IP isoform X1 n=1 Tax=Ambystoma mexicanum TaxID=8296 RepID=UPI0037E7599B